MNRIIIAIILMLVSIGTGIAGYFYTISYTKAIIETMESDRYAVIKESSTENERTKEITEMWEHNQKLLAALLPHDELENIEIGIMNLPDYAEQGLTEEYIKTLNDCINRLKHILESENPTIKNIF